MPVTLTPEQVNAYVTIGDLPVKREAAPPAGDDDDDLDDADKLTAGMKARLAKEKEKRKALEKQIADNAAALKALQEKEAEKNRSDSEKKGEYEKLLTETKALQEQLRGRSRPPGGRRPC